MKIGIVDTSLGAEGAEQSFAMAASAGADGVEVSFHDHTFGPHKAEELAALARKHSLTIPSICLSFLCRERTLVDTRGAKAKAHQQVQDAISLAGQLSANVVLIPFFGKNAINVEQDLTAAAESLAELVETAESAGVALGIESTLNTSQQLYLLDHLGRTAAAGIYYDTGNIQARKQDAATGIRDLGVGAIAQVHFKDVKTVEGSPPDFSVALGEGDVDFPAVVQALRAVGYDGWIVLETPPGDNPLVAATTNVAYVRNCIKERSAVG